VDASHRDPSNSVGDLIGVGAVIVGPTGRAEVSLILDTAAVMTTVVPSVAESIGYSPAHRVGLSVTQTAAAEEHGYIVRSELETLGSRCPVSPSANSRREIAP
jgi:hypothetical protein